MKKIKFLIASMLGAIALVFACVLGTKVNAATSHTATYEWRAGDGKGSSGDRFYFNNGSLTNTAFATAQTIDGITFTSHDVTTSSSRTLYINLTANEWSLNTVTAYVYLYTTTKTRNVTIGGVDKGKTTTNGIQYFSGTLTSSNNTILLGGNEVDWCGIDLVLASTTSYAVTFNSMGGSNVATQNVPEGGKATEPTAPTKENSMFAGWYTSEDDGATLSTTAFDFENTTINGALTLYAKWEEATVYTVNFMNGTETYSTKYVYDGVNSNKISDWPVDPIKLGYTFNGWYNSTTPYTSDSVFDASIDLTASFSQNVLEVNKTYTLNPSNANLGSNSKSNSTDGYYYIEDAKAGSGVKIDGTNFSLANSPSEGKNYLGFNIPANSYAIISLEALKGNASKNAQIDFADVLDTSAENVTTGELTTTKTAYSVIYYNNTSNVASVKMFRNGGTTVTVSSLTVSVYSSVSTLNEAQSRGTGTAIRFAATLSNVGSLDVVTKWNYTLSMDGKTDVVGADKTTLYTSISGTNGKAAADNTYYIVLTVKDIPSSFNGKTLKCKFTITLSDGSTINTDVVSQPISITA